MGARSGAAIAVLVVFAAIWPAGARSAEYAGYLWPEAGTRILAGHLCGSCDGTNDKPDWRAEFGTAAQAWNDATRFFELTVGNGRNGQSCSAKGPNRASFRKDACGDPFGSGTLAVTVTWRDGSVPEGFRVPSHVEVVFNSAREWSTYDGPLRAYEDFRRVAAHELGHVIGLAHSDDRRALVAPFISSTTTPQPDDLAGIASLYGDNQGRFLAVLGRDESQVAMLRLMPERWFRAEVRSTSDGQLAAMVPFLGATYAPFELVTLSGLAGGGRDALGLLATHRDSGAIVFQWRDPATGERMGNLYFLGPDFYPIDIEFVADADGSGRPGLALLALAADGGATLVQTRFLDSGEVMSNVYFAAGELLPRQLHALPDVDDNGIPEYAVLAERPEDERILVQTRNAVGEPNAATAFYLGDFHDVVDSAVLPGAGQRVPSVAVLARRTYDRKIVVQGRFVRGEPEPANSFFLTSRYRPQALAVFATPSGGPEYAVLARNYDTGGVLVQGKRVSDNVSTRVELFLEPGASATDVRALGDDALLVLGHRGGDDAALTQVRTLAGGATIDIPFGAN